MPQKNCLFSFNILNTIANIDELNKKLCHPDIMLEHLMDIAAQEVIKSHAFGTIHHTGSEEEHTVRFL